MHCSCKKSPGGVLEKLRHFCTVLPAGANPVATVSDLSSSRRLSNCVTLVPHYLKCHILDLLPQFIIFPPMDAWGNVLLLRNTIEILQNCIILARDADSNTPPALPVALQDNPAVTISELSWSALIALFVIHWSLVRCSILRLSRCCWVACLKGTSSLSTQLFDFLCCTWRNLDLLLPCSAHCDDPCCNPTHFHLFKL